MAISPELHAQQYALWEKWKIAGKPKQLTKQLIDTFTPAIMAEVNKYAGVTRVSPEAIKAAFRIAAIEAFATYDPGRAVNLATHVISHIRKGRRFVLSTQNIARIPEHRIQQIGAFYDAYHGLKRVHGEEPGADQLAKALGWKIKDVRRMITDLRSDVAASVYSMDPGVLSPSKGLEGLRLIRPELTPGEKRVLDALTATDPGRGQGARVAKQLGVSEAYVSQTRKKIARKLKKFWKPIEG